MKELIIRDIKFEDIPKVVDIQINGWKNAYIGIIDDDYLDSLHSEYNLRIQKMQNNYMDNGFIVAELDNQVVGFCRYIFDNSNSKEIVNADCEMSALYIEPALKRQGIGTALFKYVMNKFKKQNKSHMILWCFKDNKASIAFYKKMGGTIIKERPVKKGNKEYQEVCFLYNI